MMITAQGIPVTITDDRTGYQYPAIVYHNGRTEMYFEANYAPRPGSRCHVSVDPQKTGLGEGTRVTLVQWRKALCEPDAVWSFRLGIKYI